MKVYWGSTSSNILHSSYKNLWITDRCSRGCPTNTIVINSVGRFQYLQNSFTPKHYELGTWNFERMFTSLHVSYVMCQMSQVKFLFLFLFLFSDQPMNLVSGKVCYQWGLPRQVLLSNTLPLFTRADGWRAIHREFINILSNISII